MNKLKQLWINLLASFWFLPSLIVGVSAVSAVGVIEVDSSGSHKWNHHRADFRQPGGRIVR